MKCASILLISPASESPKTVEETVKSEDILKLEKDEYAEVVKPNGFCNHDEAEDKELVIVIENGKKPRVYQAEDQNNPFISPLARSEQASTVSMQDACVSTEDDDFEDVGDDEDYDEDDTEHTEGSSLSCPALISCLDSAFDTVLKRIFRKYSPIIPNLVIYTDTLSVIYSVDAYARKGFPLVFLGFQALYWTLYMYLL